VCKSEGGVPGRNYIAIRGGGPQNPLYGTSKRVLGQGGKVMKRKGKRKKNEKGGQNQWWSRRSDPKGKRYNHRKGDAYALDIVIGGRTIHVTGTEQKGTRWTVRVGMNAKASPFTTSYVLWPAKEGKTSKQAEKVTRAGSLYTRACGGNHLDGVHYLCRGGFF